MERMIAGWVIVMAIGCTEARVPADDGGACTCTDDSDCSDGAFCNGVEVCDACRCLAPRTPACGAGVACDEETDSCSAPCASDADGDGSCTEDDCDDADPTRSPREEEICDMDGADEDCDPTTFGDADTDGDGWVSALCCNGIGTPAERCGDDCDDSRPNVGPGRTEVCSPLDEDCDGMIDEDVGMPYFLDRDGDGYGDGAAPVLACGPGAGRASNDLDCDDSQPTRHPGRPETCNSVDDDCDAVVDEAAPSISYHPDEDGDGYGSADGGSILSCARPDGYAPNDDDCDDTRAGTHPGAIERCDGGDDDCDGTTDEGCDCIGGESRPCTAPGRCAAGEEACFAGAWTECSIAPVAETCNGEDDDCDGAIDEICP